MIIIRIFEKIKRFITYVKDVFLFWLLDYTSLQSIKKVVKKVAFHNRKIVGFYGECHMYIYGAALSQNKKIHEKYVLVGAKEIEYMVKRHSKRINKSSAWNTLDILIYNPGVPIRMGAPSLQQVLSWVSDDCKLIEVTNAAFKGYMPQHTEKVFNNPGLFTWGDKNLNKILAEGSVTGKFDYNNVYSYEYVNSYFDKAIKNMKIYEKDCTIKISDYIEKNGRKRALYYSVTHPETEVMIEITRRIFCELGIDISAKELTITQKSFDLHSHGEVIYPDVHKALGLMGDPYQRRIQPGNFKEKTYTIDEYVTEYIKIGSCEMNVTNGVNNHE